MTLNPNFHLLKELKQKFNKEYFGKPDETEVRLDALIEEYMASKYDFFKYFSEILKKEKEGDYSLLYKA